MDQIAEFFEGLFAVNDWPARWVCGRWTEFHGWLYIGSDVAIWLAYFVIPVIIIWFIQTRPNIPFLPVFWLFGAFIILCGTTHLIDALIFWWPAYRLSALAKLITAIVSMATIFALIRDIPKFLDLTSPSSPKDVTDRSSADWQALLAAKEKEIKALQVEVDQLKAKRG